jgi:hypothetical protein
MFKWRQTAPELILCAVRWYLRYSLSLRDVEELFAERGLEADHTTVATMEQIVAEGGGTIGRVFAVRHRVGDIDWRKAAAMNETDAPRYSHAMRGFTDWVAPRYDKVLAAAEVERAAARDRAATTDVHTRTPAAIAALYTALKFFADYAVDEGAISDAEARAMLDEAWSSFAKAGAEQQRDVQHEVNEVDTFFELLSAAIKGGRAHLKGEDGGTPDFFQAACGWEPHDRHTLNGDLETESRPRGDCAGYVWLNKFRQPQIGLDPVNAHAAARELDHRGSLLPLAELARRLKDDGRLVEHEENPSRRTGTKRKTIGEHQLSLWWVKTEDALGESAAQQQPLPRQPEGSNATLPN